MTTTTTRTRRTYPHSRTQTPQWDRWPSFFAGLFQLACPTQPRPTRLTVASVCAGTDAPVLALETLLGSQNIEYVWGCDSWHISRAFVQANFRPGHLFSHVEAVNQDDDPHCLVCEGPCNAMKRRIDLAVAASLASHTAS